MTFKYGRQFPIGWTEYMVELWMWKNYPNLKNAELPRWEHLKNSILLAFPRNRHNWHPWLDWICQTYAEYSYIAGVGCSSSTKTHSFHMLAYMDYMSDPLHTQVICTTTSVQGLKTRMWPIITELYKQTNPANWSIRANPHMEIRANKDDPKHAIRATPIAAKADKNEIIDNIIGAHTDRIIWIVDEATSAPQATDSAWSNLSGSTSHRRFIKLGNPDDQLDTLGLFCRPTLGWDSVNENTLEWDFVYQGEKGKALHFNGLNSPNLAYPKNDDGSSKWPFMFGHFDVERHEKNKEVRPLDYWRFCLGWYADASLVPKVITMKDIEESKCRFRTVFVGRTEAFAALDPAYGGDRCILKIFCKGIDSDTQKPAMEQIESIEVPVPADSIKGKAIGDFVIQKCREHGVFLIGIDTTTDNSAPAEYIKLNSEIEVYDITFGGMPSDEAVSPTNQTSCRDMYDRKVTELWFTVKECLPQIRNLDEETVIELCSRYYKKTKSRPEKLSIETKTEMKVRMSGKSPDLADCLAIATSVFRKLGGFEKKGSDTQNRKWNDLAKKKNNIFNSEKAYDNT
jgi:hypothetical protein